MSLFLFLGKLSARRYHKCFFSSMRPTPLMLRSYEIDRSPRQPSKENNVTFSVIEAANWKADTLLIKERKLPEHSGYKALGLSRGWVAFMHMTERGWIIRVTDIFKPWVSSPKSIPLPALGFLPNTLISEMSYSCPHLCGKCLVAGIFSKEVLSICTPSSDKWTHMEDHSRMGLLLPADKLIYSSREKTFYFTCDWSFQLGSVDVSNKKLNSHSVRFGSLPEIHDRGWLLLNYYSSYTKHVVESPSGELFYIIWYTKRPPEHDPFDDDIHITLLMRFMVFKQDEMSKEFYYTEDIGDLSIFISQGGKGEDFCVTASMYPGLNPNSIYYLSDSFHTGTGSYCIASRQFHSFLNCVCADFWISPH